MVGCRRYLDVSFNVFRRIEGLTHEGLPHLTELYLIAAKISKIEGKSLSLSLSALSSFTPLLHLLCYSSPADIPRVLFAFSPSSIQA